MVGKQLLLLLAVCYCIHAHSIDSNQQVLNGDTEAAGFEMSELNLKGHMNQAARINLGSGPSTYSMGVNPDGFFTVSHDGTDVFSASKTGVETPNLIVGTMSAFDFVLAGQPQWRMVNLESFEPVREKTNKKAAGEQAKAFVHTAPTPVFGWTTTNTINCAGLTMITQTDTQPLAKLYTGLPAHSHVRITATAHFVDDWQGETAFLKVNDHIVWTESHEQRAGAGKINVCGSSVYPEGKFSVPIDVTLPYTGSTLKVVFGTNLDKGSDAHFGISSVALSVRSKEGPAPARS